MSNVIIGKFSEKLFDFFGYFFGIKLFHYIKMLCKYLYKKWGVVFILEIGFDACKYDCHEKH